MEPFPIFRRTKSASTISLKITMIVKVQLVFLYNNKNFGAYGLLRVGNAIFRITRTSKVFLSVTVSV